MAETDGRTREEAPSKGASGGWTAGPVVQKERQPPGILSFPGRYLPGLGHADQHTVALGVCSKRGHLPKKKNLEGSDSTEEKTKDQQGKQLGIHGLAQPKEDTHKI